MARPISRANTIIGITHPSNASRTIFFGKKFTKASANPGTYFTSPDFVIGILASFPILNITASISPIDEPRTL